MKWVIVILMCCSFAQDENDSLEIGGKDGKPLIFTNPDDCVFHVENNYIELALFAQRHFDGKVAQTIFCVQKPEEV